MAMKIAICLPIHSGAHPLFVRSLSRLVAFTLMVKLEGPEGPIVPHIETFVFSTSNVAFSRRKLAEMALEWDAEWLFWLDADHTFPPDTLARLLAAGRAVIGANYRRRDPERVIHTAVGLNHGEPDLADGEGTEEILHLGLGVCLTHSAVFRKIGQPYFSEEIHSDGMTTIGEDVNFCRKARAAGFPIHVDHALSREVGHMAFTELRLP